jgi:hypothetical protein
MNRLINPNLWREAPEELYPVTPLDLLPDDEPDQPDLSPWPPVEVVGAGPPPDDGDIPF